MSGIIVVVLGKERREGRRGGMKGKKGKKGRKVSGILVVVFEGRKEGQERKEEGQESEWYYRCRIWGKERREGK